jgi:hypothetical protein
MFMKPEVFIFFTHRNLRVLYLPAIKLPLLAADEDSDVTVASNDDDDDDS